MMPLMPSPGRPKTTSTPQSINRSTSDSAAIRFTIAPHRGSGGRARRTARFPAGGPVSCVESEVAPTCRLRGVPLRVCPLELDSQPGPGPIRPQETARLRLQHAVEQHLLDSDVVVEVLQV